MCESVKFRQNYGREFVASLFWPSLYTADQHLRQAVSYLSCHPAGGAVMKPAQTRLKRARNGQRFMQSLVEEN